MHEHSGAPELHRTTTFPVSSLSDLPALLDAMSAALRWYQGAEARRLRVDLHAWDPSPAGLEAVRLLVERMRAENDFLKQDPPVVVAMPGRCITPRVLDALEALDTRSPRLKLLATWDDGEAFRSLAEELGALRARLAGRHLAVHSLFLLSFDWANVEALRHQLIAIDLEGGEPARLLFERSPVVEAPWTAACASVERFVAHAFELWCAFSALNDSIALSPGGALRELYRAKELWALERGSGAGRGATHAAPERAPAVPSRLRELREAVARRLAEEPGLYERCSGSAKRVVLDNDWDFVFDSYECQSPIFAAPMGAGAASPEPAWPSLP
jgi:hypothetical protein